MRDQLEREKLVANKMYTIVDEHSKISHIRFRPHFQLSRLHQQLESKLHEWCSWFSDCCLTRLSFWYLYSNSLFKDAMINLLWHRCLVNIRSFETKNEELYCCNSFLRMFKGWIYHTTDFRMPNLLSY